MPLTLNETMFPIVIVFVILIGVMVAVILSIHINPNQSIECPHCKLEFVSDLFLLQENTLVQCPFCHKWMTAQKVREKYHARKIFRW
jgi:uncharacterized Zn-finger protein